MDYSSMSWGSGMPILWHEDDDDAEFEWCSSSSYKVINDRDENRAQKTKKLKSVCSLKGHSNDVTSVDFAGRNLLATGSLDKTVRLYKCLPGDKFEELPHSPLKGHRYGINSICFSPYGTKLASASTDGQTVIWDVKTGENLVSLRLSGKTGAGVRTCAFSPNSALLATGGDGDTAALWDISLFSLVREIEGHESTVASVSFSPDSSCLATGSANGDLKIWDAMYGHALPLGSKVEAHDLGITCLHFNPSIGKDSNIITGTKYMLASGGQDTDLRIWMVGVGSKNVGRGSRAGEVELATVELHHTLCGHKAPIMMVKFGPSGLYLASASGDKTVRLWDAVHFISLVILAGHKRYVTSCAFSEDGGLIAAGGGDRTIHVWRVNRDVMDTLGSSQSASQTASRSASQRRALVSNLPGRKVRENKRLINWSSTDVSEWLGEEGLGEYSPNFRSQLINGRELMTLSDVVLETKLGVDALGHRNRILRLINKLSADDASGDGVSVAGSGPSRNGVPSEFFCPITQELIKDPVLCADGFSYEREAVEAWLAGGKETSPLTNEKLPHSILTPNRTLRNLIRKYLEQTT